MRAISLLCAAFALIVTVSLGSGCVYTPTGPGVIYTNAQSTLGPAGGSDGMKRGESCARVFLALFGWGDASLETAKRSAQITEVSQVDHESFVLLGFGSFCTIVYGT